MIEFVGAAKCRHRRTRRFARSIVEWCLACGAIRVPSISERWVRPETEQDAPRPAEQRIKTSRRIRK